MWNISNKVKEKFTKSHILPIHESDQDWEIALRDAKEEGENLTARLRGELEEVKEELIHILPSRFIPYVENGTLNQPTLPKTVREDYLQWVQQSSREFEHVLDAAYENTTEAISYLPPKVKDVFLESLHDATIERIQREKDTLHLYINTEGGFSTKSHVHLIFKNVLEAETNEPITVEQWLVYNELQKTNDGFAFRVLFECPEVEWTITMKDIDAEYYYRPLTYMKLREEGQIDGTTLTQYILNLNKEHDYWFITPHVTCAIKGFSENINLVNGKIEFRQNEMVVKVGNELFTYNLEEYNPIKFIYTNVYEDPYEQFKIPMPTEEIEAAILGKDLDLQVRAWNTMYANPEELADTINHVLEKIEIAEKNEMMISVFVSHFYKKGILTEKIIEKFRAVIE